MIHDAPPAIVHEGRDIVGEIIAYEGGELDDAGVIDLFQYLINSGMAWTLQGAYGRQAVALINAGLCHAKQK